MKLTFESLESRSMMAVAPVDPELRSLYSADMMDGQVSRGEMIALFQSSTDGGSVNATELADLRKIVAGSVMAGDVKCLANNLIASRPTAANMAPLIDKWFLGKDRPSIGGYANVSYQQVSGSLFVNGAGSSDIKQGQVGDCYLLAGLGALADKNNAAVSSMFRDNMDGTWNVRFYRLDGTKYVEDWVSVDRYLPTNSAGYPVFQGFGGAASDPRNELWAALAEKAYAQWARGGSYQGLSGGWSDMVFSQVTGSQASGYSDMGLVDTTLANAVKNGNPVVIYRYMDAARTQAHAYYVQSCANGTFYLKNPWGMADLTLTSAQVKSQCYGFAIATKVSGPLASGVVKLI